MEKNQEDMDIDQIIRHVASWERENPSSFYDRELDSRCYIVSESAAEIMAKYQIE